jgi:DNA mismatch repair protein PMS2
MRCAVWLQDLSSFGFRGEALSSLCAVSEVTISTRTESSASGMRIFYDHAGGITSTVPVARARGTTVAVKDLFKPLPVRYKVAHPRLLSVDSPCLSQRLRSA